jgi:hypothetical protein
MSHPSRFSRFAVLLVILLTCACAFTLAQNEDQTGEFHWTGTLPADQVVEIKNLNGSITAQGYDGNQIEVTAEKIGPDADAVKIEVVPHAEGVTICAIYPGGSSGAETGPCEPGKHWHSDSHNAKVKVNFTVRIPTNLRFTGMSVNGSVKAEGMGRFVYATSVNGSVHASTKQWAELSSVNGSIEGHMGSDNWTGTLKISTVNGSIDLTMPNDLNADVRFSSVNGKLNSDYPLTISGSLSGHRVEGQVGTGGRKLVLDTVNGSVRIRRESM